MYLERPFFKHKRDGNNLFNIKVYKRKERKSENIGKPPGGTRSDKIGDKKEEIINQGEKRKLEELFYKMKEEKHCSTKHL